MIKYLKFAVSIQCGSDARGYSMTFLNDSGGRSALWTGKNLTEKTSTYKKVITLGLLTVIFVSVNITGCAAAEIKLVNQALGMIASLPESMASVHRRSDIEEVAHAAISSVKSIADLMKQAHEVSAMLPSTRQKNQALPKLNTDIAMLVAARVPELPIPVTPAPKPAQEAPKESVAAGSKVSLPGAHNLIWPVDGLIYSGFNATRGRRIHGAIDIVTKKGTPIAAAADGIVSVAANGGREFSGYGKIVILDHGNGLYTLYAHCDSLLVKMGQQVKQGEYIATVGRTGRATTDHCHFEVRISGKKYDPIAYLPSRPEIIRATNYRSR